MCSSTAVGSRLHKYWFKADMDGSDCEGVVMTAVSEHYTKCLCLVYLLFNFTGAVTGFKQLPPKSQHRDASKHQ